jgi:hypothetical protein
MAIPLHIRLAACSLRCKTYTLCNTIKLITLLIKCLVYLKKNNNMQKVAVFIAYHLYV